MNRIDKPIYFCDVLKNTRLPIHIYIYTYICITKKGLPVSRIRPRARRAWDRRRRGGRGGGGAVPGLLGFYLLSRVCVR